jgi:hypothetical protein
MQVRILIDETPLTLVTTQNVSNETRYYYCSQLTDPPALVVTRGQPIADLTSKTYVAQTALDDGYRQFVLDAKDVGRRRLKITIQQQCPEFDEAEKTLSELIQA